MSKTKHLGPIPESESGVAKPDDRLYETPWWIAEQLDRLHGLPAGAEVEISRHTTIKAAGVRIAQMRRTKRWGLLPITLRAGEARYIQGDDRKGAIFMSLSDTPLAETARRRMQLRFSVGSQAEKAKLLLRVVDAYNNNKDVTIPKEFYKVTLPGPTQQQMEAMEEVDEL